MAKDDDGPSVPLYGRRPLSNYEGFKRLDKSLERIAGTESAAAKLCDVCHKRTRAWRMVPATFGANIKTKASVGRGALRGKFVLACDNGPDSCAAMLDRSGVPREAIREQERIDELGKLGIAVPS